MEIFEYEITTYEPEIFHNVLYFCSDDGRCAVDKIPKEQQMLSKVLNGRGLVGWELIQLFFGTEGIMAFWKRKKATTEGEMNELNFQGKRDVL